MSDPGPSWPSCLDVYSTLALTVTVCSASGNRMQVIFTNIDEKDPSSQFYFFLQIEGSSRKYVGKSGKTSGSGCSKLTTSLVNSSLKFQTFIPEICQYFLFIEKKLLTFSKKF